MTVHHMHLRVNGLEMCQSRGWTQALMARMRETIDTGEKYRRTDFPIISCGQIDDSQSHRNSINAQILDMLPGALIEWVEGECPEYHRVMSEQEDRDDG